MRIKAKPGPTARARAAKARKDQRYAALVREEVAARDGYCRYAKAETVGTLTMAMLCAGQSEWAHVGAKRRFKTRGMRPQDRHSTRDSLMLCTKHHRQYDARKLWITTLTDAGCDGPVRFIIEDC